MTIFAYILASSWHQKLRFFLLFFVIFTFTYSIFFVLDWLPETPATASSAVTVSAQVTNGDMVATEIKAVIEPVLELPREISIPSLKRKVKISNPTSSVVADLDADLLKGVVRHPDSARLGENGNVFILGHSSYLPTVFNKNFQAFNGLQDLVWGDSIIVKSATKEYVYQVKKVYKAKASALTVPVIVEGQRLTLATCNSFGSVDDRFIVEAELVDTRPLS